MSIKEKEFKIRLSESLATWLEQQKKSTGKSYSQLINECVQQSANQEFQQLVNQLAEQNDVMKKLYTEVIKTQDQTFILTEILNYMLNENRCVGEFTENSDEHLVTKEIKQKIHSLRIKEIQMKQKAKKFSQQ